MSQDETMKSIDLACVILEVGPKDSLPSKDGGAPKFRQQWTVTDDTNNSIVMTLWGSEFIDKHATIK